MKIEERKQLTESYPRLLRRISASNWNGLIVFFSIVVVLSVVLVFFGPGLHIALIAGTIIFILGPLLVSLTGGNLGHHFFGIRVVRKSTGKNLNIFLAIIRYLTMILFGIFSFISIFTTRRHEAFHDLLAGSVVVLKKPEILPYHEVLKERVIEEPEYTYPSRSRRIFLIIVYNLLLFVILSFLSAVILSEACFLNDACSLTEVVINAVLSITWLTCSALIIISAWKGLLIGCRRSLST